MGGRFQDLYSHQTNVTLYILRYIGRMPTEEKRGGWSSQTPSTHWSGWYFERLGLPKIPFSICILMVRFAKLGQNTGGKIQRQLVENVPGRMVRRFDNISFYDLLPKKLCCRCHWQMKSSAWCWCSLPIRLSLRHPRFQRFKPIGGEDDADHGVQGTFHGGHKA